MAEGPTGSSPTQDIFFFLALLGGLFALWVATGGPDRSPEENLFMRVTPRGEILSADNFSTSGSIGEKRDVEENIYDIQKEIERIQEDLKQARIRGTASPYEGMVTIRGGRAKERYPQTEYLELVADSGNESDVPVTGWRLESVVTGQSATIGDGTHLPYPGIVNTESTIFMSPREKLLVTTGRSPIGTNFQVNMCVGYFEQFQNYAPRLRRECPSPVDEFDELSTLPTTNVRIEKDDREICRDFIIDNIDRCEINRVDLSDTELRLTNKCKDFIEPTYTYSGCVANHRFDAEFYKNEWRVFLGSSAELWREKREIIRLLDQNGQTVDVFDY